MLDSMVMSPRINGLPVRPFPMPRLGGVHGMQLLAKHMHMNAAQKKLET